MIEITQQPDEAHIDFLFGSIADLRRRLDEAVHKANAATESRGRAALPPVGQGKYWAQVTTAIPAMSSGGDVALTGAVALCIALSPSSGNVQFYRRYPAITISGIVNGTGGAVAVYTLVIVEMIDGRWTVVEADCAQMLSAALPNQPTGSSIANPTGTLTNGE